MNVGQVCKREVVSAYRATPLGDAARLMRANHVGSLVVVDEGEGGRVPVGVLTDRDIVVAVVASDLNPRTLTVGEVMAADPITIREEASILDAMEVMRRRGIRRVPVIAATGQLAGIVTFDDLLGIVGEQLGDFVRAMAIERVQEAHYRK